MGFSTPILFLIFNRPKHTQKVFDVLRELKPSKLYVSGDGPRPSRPDDPEKIAQTRAVLNQIDWECEVHTRFNEDNLGCKNAVSQGISWFFSEVEEGIILEDDCLPDLSFFTFCASMLSRYRNNAQIMHIGGTNFQDGKKRGDGSYYFSRFPHIWGWASWRRAWNKYNVDLKSFSEEDWNIMIQKVLREPAERFFFFDSRDRIINGQLDTWDFQWTFAIWKSDGIVISPNYNLVTNIGFGDDATHTMDPAAKNAGKLLQSLNEIVHPAKVEVDKKADKYTAETLFKSSTTFEKYKYQIKRAIKSLFSS